MNCRIFAGIRKPLKTNFIRSNYLNFAFSLLWGVLLGFKGNAQLTAAFSASVTSGCSNLAVSFKDESTGSPTSWFWDFGDGQTSAERNPTITYTASGSFTVRLIVRNDQEEDYEEKTAYIKVFRTPQATFSSDVSTGCSPLNVAFTDNTSLTGVTVKSRTWDFGDGTTSSEQNPSHIFTGTKTYYISLTIETTDGCASQAEQEESIHVGTSPTAAFTATPLDGCAAELRQFTNKSSSNVKSWSWSFGDSSTSTEESPLHHYEDSGWFSVRLIVNNNGCRDTLTKNNYIHVKAPAGRIFVNPDCSDPFKFGFSAVAYPGTAYQWSFGDGETATDRSSTHVYAAEGAYNVKLRVDDGICYDTTSDYVFVSTVKPVANVVSTPPYCHGTSVQFAVSQYNTDLAKDFRWDYGDGVSTAYKSTNDTVNHTYDTVGYFRPTAFFRNIYNCIDTITLDSIQIVGPTAGFSWADTACTEIAMSFLDLSVAGGSSIQQWFWSFGDGRTSSVQAPAINYFDFPLLYNVKLTVTDENGCTSSKTQQVQVYTTPTITGGNDTLVCAGQSVVLTAGGASTYTWKTDGASICDSCTVSPTVIPDTTANYYVTGTTSEGCAASDTLLIAVQQKEQVSIQPGDTAICAQDSLQLNASGTENYSWFPSTGLSSAAIANPVASPAATTSYSVAGSDSNHCFFDTATINITVNARPSVDIADTEVTLPVGSTQTLQSTSSADVVDWQWTPQTGLSCYNCPAPVATMGSPVTYFLTVYNAAGCSSTDSVKMIPVCTDNFVYIPNAFTPNNDGLNDYFYPNAKIPITVKYMTVFNRWGEKVFEKNNFLSNTATLGWNGKSRSLKQTFGTYVYMMQLICVDGSIINVKGTVTLLP
ncbi:PKD domain-containing protein [Parafilimonas sp.]|uniref:gliding motility-associated C-terminal domain-containing protein n=1 Tax=Parafilimonas sp. TaxID=1969739 RepID=UPI0039E470AA